MICNRPRALWIALFTTFTVFFANLGFAATPVSSAAGLVPLNSHSRATSAERVSAERAPNSLSKAPNWPFIGPAAAFVGPLPPVQLPAPQEASEKTNPTAATSTAAAAVTTSPAEAQSPAASSNSSNSLSVADSGKVAPAAADSAPPTLADRLAEVGSAIKDQTLQTVERAQNTVANWQQQGLASWYGPGFHGRKTASGERFNTNELTAAHLSLPFGTRLLVRNESNGREVIVRVNDRGPYIKTRIIDLSHAAARALGIDGVGRVIIQRLANDEDDDLPHRSAD